MPGELEELAAKATVLAEAAADRPEGAQARRVAERSASGRFLVSLVGEFKRGKSTLLNALLGAEVVPTGVLPLTAAPIELAFGDPGITVEHLDGAQRSIDSSQLDEYVTEAANPSNQRQVARVEVRGGWPLLAPGVVLVDTPGIGSIYRHNTETAQAALLDADGAIVVLSADAPLSDQEHELLKALAGRHKPTFFVLNRVDHLSSSELDEVRTFVDRILQDDLGRSVPVYALAARPALEARLLGRAPGPESGEFNAFFSELERFIADDLVRARLTSTRLELARLGGSLRDAVAVEEASLNLDAATLAEQAARFRTEADRQRAAFDDECTLLRRDVTRLGDQVGQRLSTFARAEPARHLQQLAAVAASAPRSQLDDQLREAIESAVRDAFEAFRATAAEGTEQSWQDLAQRFRARTQERVDAVRQAAATLFAVPLPRVVVPTVDEERERFFYLFIHVGASTEPFTRVLGRLVPNAVARRRALARAQPELVREFDKHAGRAHWDLAQRLDEVRRRFETAMRSELDGCTDAIVYAASRAEQLRHSADQERARRAIEIERQQQLAATLVSLAEQPA